MMTIQILLKLNKVSVSVHSHMYAFFDNPILLLVFKFCQKV